MIFFPDESEDYYKIKDQDPHPLSKSYEIKLKRNKREKGVNAHACEIEYRKQRKGSKKRKRLVKRDPHCFYCRIPLNFYNSTLDHKVPKSKGGKNNIENLALSCYSCNSRKSSKSVEEFLEELAKEIIPACEQLHSIGTT